MKTPPDSPYIVAITGSKGKTTVTRLVDHVLQESGQYTLRVDSDGHYVKGKQKSTHADSMRLHGYVTTICPGRYLYELRRQSHATAILEESFDCSRAGTGYRAHHIGVFTNVTDEHLGRRIKSRQHLAEEKARYIFKKIAPGGVAIFNADDELVVEQLRTIKPRKAITLIPVGLTFKYFDLKKHLENGGQAIGLRKGKVVLYKGTTHTPIIDIRHLKWTFNGYYQPSVRNVMFTCAIIFAREQSNFSPANTATALQSYEPALLGGRLVRLESKKRGLTVIIDYAHSKLSLLYIASLAKKLTRKKTIGIVRLAPDRPQTAIEDTAAAIANKFDTIIVYDKIDGIARATYHGQVRDIKRGPGETAHDLGAAIQRHQTPPHTVHTFVSEQDAIAQAFALAEADDVIVHISNDNHAQSLSYIRSYL